MRILQLCATEARCRMMMLMSVLSNTICNHGASAAPKPPLRLTRLTQGCSDTANGAKICGYGGHIFLGCNGADFGLPPHDPTVKVRFFRDGNPLATAARIGDTLMFSYGTYPYVNGTYTCTKTDASGESPPSDGIELQNGPCFDYPCAKQRGPEHCSHIQVGNKMSGICRCIPVGIKRLSPAKHCVDPACRTMHCADAVAASKCALNTTSAQCECPAGQVLNATSTLCEDIDECETAPCHNGGTCINGINDYNCTCVPTYSGKNCDVAYVALTPAIGGQPDENTQDRAVQEETPQKETPQTEAGDSEEPDEDNTALIALIIGCVVGSLVMVAGGVGGLYCWSNRRGARAPPREAEEVGGTGKASTTDDQAGVISPYESSVDAP